MKEEDEHFYRIGWLQNHKHLMTMEQFLRWEEIPFDDKGRIEDLFNELKPK